LCDQKRIVTFLDKAFEKLSKAKENAETNLQNAKEIFESYLQSIFENKGEGWEEKPLRKVCEKTTNIRWQDNSDKEFQYIDLSSVSRDSLSITNTSLINEKNAPSRAKKIISENDIIFGATRPTLKRVAKINRELDGQICSTGFVVLKPIKKAVLPDMIFYYLQTQKFMKEMEKIQKGASYPAVTDNEVKRQIISLPALDEQKSIVTKLGVLSQETKKLEFIYNKKLGDLEELKQSILQKAFKGELTEALT
jgi:type I restriction enzyme S subunit